MSGNRYARTRIASTKVEQSGAKSNSSLAIAALVTSVIAVLVSLGSLFVNFAVARLNHRIDECVAVAEKLTTVRQRLVSLNKLRISENEDVFSSKDVFGSSPERTAVEESLGVVEIELNRAAIVFPDDLRGKIIKIQGVVEILYQQNYSVNLGSSQDPIDLKALDVEIDSIVSSCKKLADQTPLSWLP